MGEAKKYQVVSSEKQEHWRKPSRPLDKKQTKVIVVGTMPEYEIDKNGQLKKDESGEPKKVLKIDWLGADIEKFDKALQGDNNDVPHPL
jgi:hypothetical protein